MKHHSIDVLMSDEARGQRLGVDLMGQAARSMRDRGGVAFGYLGCREDVAPFYAACGWGRIHAGERSIAASLESWLNGDIDLRGRAW